MLSLSSVLHYWSARYGPVALVGGKPVHSRSSAGRWIDQQGVLQSAIVNTPRLNWATIDSERRPVLTLEPARTNNLLYSSDFSNAAWSKTNLSVTTGVLDPTGGIGACTLTATSNNAEARQTLSAGANIVRTNSCWLRRRTGAGTVRLIRNDGGDLAVAIDATWRRFSIAGVASASRIAGVQVASNTDAVDVFLCQQEDASTITAGIDTTTAAATRAADQFRFDYLPPPQALMVYCRFIERGSIIASPSVYVLYFGSSAGTGAKLFFYQDGSSFVYRFQHNNDSTANEAATAVAPAVGDVVELVGILTGGGSVQIIQSINGAAVTASGVVAVGPLAPYWGDTKLHLDGLGSGSIGLVDFAEVKVVKHADVAGVTSQAIMDELRAFELGPNGAVL